LLHRRFGVRHTAGKVARGAARLRERARQVAHARAGVAAGQLLHRRRRIADGGAERVRRGRGVVKLPGQAAEPAGIADAGERAGQRLADAARALLDLVEQVLERLELPLRLIDAGGRQIDFDDDG
jgi:hypothetical protein